jgi:ribosomal protein S18 acetylase RimI-like enzyme
MMWQVRALLEDRPGALAALAVTFGDQRVNILNLQIFPVPDGRVVDELVLHSPGGWTAQDVEQLFELAGIGDVTVDTCSAKALEDQPVRYLRAVHVLADEPHRLEEQLCRLLDAFPADGLPGLDTLVLDDDHGPSVRLQRRTPFTDTELARAAELRRLAGSMMGADDPQLLRAEPVDEYVDPEQVVLRAASGDDVNALVAMHRRCSEETVYRRYHVPMPHVTPRLARGLLDPPAGLCLVLTVGDDIVATGVLAAGPDGAEVGIMVEDRWQRHGLGTRLLHALAVEAAVLGLETLTCLVQPDNDAALTTVRRAGLRARVSACDGLTRYTIPLRGVAEADRGRSRRSRPAMGEITAPLVSLLHGRHELRDIHPAADLIDQAVRGGA